jgi:subtilisin family serine protease
MCFPQSIYGSVMKNTIAKGVIVVKAAGNSGAEGPFRADVATAVGAITVASVDAADSAPRISKFSSYGPVRRAGSGGNMYQVSRLHKTHRALAPQ